MPKKATDYSKTVQYKIICNDPAIPDVYNGHTTSFVKRKNYHKNDCYNENGKNYDYPLYKRIRENGGWSNYTMIEIEKYPCADGNEARARERYWYETLKSNLNGVCPNRSKKECDKIYGQMHKDEIRTKHQIYNAIPENTIRIREYQKAYRLRTKTNGTKKEPVDNDENDDSD